LSIVLCTTLGVIWLIVRRPALAEQQRVLRGTGSGR
jgi:hypothetical protein